MLIPSLNWKDYDYQNINLDAERLEEILAEDRIIEFDLENPPLVRFCLITVSQDLYYFLFTFHHLLFDGWCASIIMNDLNKIYTRLIEHRVPKLDKSRPYRDFIEWLQSCDYENSKEFWKNYLKNTSVTRITNALATKDNNQNKNEYATYNHEFSRKETQNFISFARTQKITLSTLFQAAWYMVLRYYTQEDDITFGVVFSGRNVPVDGIEKTLGLFINTLPLRINIDGKANVKDLLNVLMKNSITLQRMAHIPLFQIQNWAGIKEQNSLFDTILIFENHYIEPMDSDTSQLRLELLDTFEPTEYPLTILLSPGEEILVNFNYKEESFNKNQIKSIKDHFINAISFLISNLETSLTAINLITKSEKSMILTAWNNTEIEHPINTIHQTFEEQVIKSPQKIAIIFNDKELTFLQLNNKANQLAHYLIENGVRPYQRVAVSLERSSELIISILAILKIGAVYVPIDPNYPLERAKYMIEDSRAFFIIKTKNNEIFKEYDINVLHTNVEDIKLDNYPNFNITSPPEVVESDIIYTSGSSGKPKGVAQTHVARLNRFYWMWDKYPFFEDDVCCQKTSISFTDTIWETLGPLLKGVKLVIFQDDIAKDPILLINTINKYKITRIVLVPTMLQAIVKTARLKNLEMRSLKLCTVSGEACPVSLAKNFMAINPHTLLLNIYGSTESCADVTFYESNRIEAIYSNLPIGKPLNNFRTYIVDKQLNLLAPGIAGEICISGVGVADGYLNNPGLTREKFIINPYASEDKYKVLLKTGDIGRYLLDGNIEYLGRTDSQVKIRGARIDLMEIQALLISHPLVDDAIVVMRGIELEEKYLVAYIVCTNEFKYSKINSLKLKKILTNKLRLRTSKPSVNIAKSALKKKDCISFTKELKNYLVRFIPNFMIPSHFIYIENIPITLNGKIDYQALAPPDLTVRSIEDQYVAPGNSYEKELYAIWSEVLGIDNIGVHDNFFMIGGHSLLGIQVITQIYDIYKIDIPLKYVFDYPTISDLSNAVDKLIKNSATSSHLSITVEKRNAPIPISFAQQRLWIFEKMMPNTATYNISRVLRFEGLLNIAAFESAINDIVKRHESLRTVFSLDDDKPFQVILPNFTVKLSEHFIKLTYLKSDEICEPIESIIKDEINKPFKFDSEPLIRIKLISLSNIINIVIFTIHHIICDGWSIRIFLDELCSLYNAYKSKNDILLPKLPFQYADFSIW